MPPEAGRGSAIPMTARALIAGGSPATCMEQMDRIDGIVRRLMSDLGRTGWLRERPAGSQRHQRIFSRFSRMTTVITSTRNAHLDPHAGGALRRASSEWISREHWDEMIYGLLFYQMVQSYEHVAKIMAEILDGGRLGTAGPPQIFDILRRIGRDVECGEFEALLNRRLRNALAHGDYWINEGRYGWYLVYDGAPRGGLAMGDISDEYFRIYGVHFALQSWYGEWLKHTGHTWCCIPSCGPSCRHGPGGAGRGAGGRAA